MKKAALVILLALVAAGIGRAAALVAEIISATRITLPVVEYTTGV